VEATVRLGQSTLSPGDREGRDGNSIITEAAPSELAADYVEPRVAAAPEEAEGFNSGLPVVGTWPLERQQRAMVWLFGAGLAALLLAALLAITSANRSASQVAAAGQATTQSQRLAKSVSQAIVGSTAAFPEVRESVDVLSRTVRSLATGDGEVAAAPADLQEQLAALAPLIDRADKNAAIVLKQQETLTQVGAALRTINRQSGDLLETAETVSSLKLQGGASAAELSAVGQLVMLTQRIGKSANEFLTSEGVSAEAVFLLGKDLNSFKQIAEGVLQGNAELRLPGTRDAQARERLERLLAQYETTRKEAAAILSNLQGLVAAREAQAAIVTDSEPLRRGLDTLQQGLAGSGGFGGWRLLLGLVALAALVAGGIGLLRLFVIDQTARARGADLQRQEAERQEQEAKRVNDANQAAILRLMNELQTVAEGDLTQQATVTEDITGAIADSVNYTVEELRTLVEQVQTTVGRVTETTAQVETTSIELLGASTEQLREIRETGEEVLQMAGRINDVSAQAQETAAVARQSLQAAEQGLEAVNNAIGGMNSIRDQIQETSKRIKRLGESSQEIGDIVSLINDISDQTNILALNAAIQASMAGDAGRGFAVVADEVQRLAERSGAATKQIEALVKTIQSDTQEAVLSMEQTTAEVVRGARLAEDAGVALEEIESVSKNLAALIQNISNAARQQASSAGHVSNTMNIIQEITSQTSAGTTATAQSIGKLAGITNELRNSVAGFTLPDEGRGSGRAR
jgi:twitching motility protein PilJ